MTAQERLDKCGLQRPDQIGESEYRAIYETLLDAMTEPDDREDELMLAILDSFIDSANYMKGQMSGCKILAERRK